MKNNLIPILFLFISPASDAQKSISLPFGFERAIAPDWVKKSQPEKNIDLNRISPLLSINNSSITVTEQLVGYSFYDQQTTGSINNCLCVNDDGTISAAWTFSPNAIISTTPAFPNLGSGYNFFNGSGWLYPSGPTQRQENERTGFPNVVVTPTAELLITHSFSSPSGWTYIVVLRRSGRGTGSWAPSSYPFGNSFDSYPKACAAASSGSNENVYMIFHGGSSASNSIGPIYFSRSQDGGLNWSPKTIIALIDTPYYSGFKIDNYSIDARDSIVTIGYGSQNTDVGILKSTDFGTTWTKTIIQQYPSVPLPDTIISNGGDIQVLIDNSGMVHAWFSSLDFSNDTLNGAQRLPYSDGLEYWNESMGANNYVEISAAQDFNGDGIINFPRIPPLTCTQTIPAGEFGAGLTIQPSAGIDANGKIYLSYSSVDERTDTNFIKALRRHIYLMSLAPPYNPASWTYPEDILSFIANGGDGENQEGVFACMGKRVDNNNAYVLYQRDNYPGHSIVPSGTCGYVGFGNSSDLIISTIDVTTLDVPSTYNNDLFVNQNFPNPASGVTHINIGLKKVSDINLEICDITGRTVYWEARKKVAAGNCTLSIDTSNLNPGVYLYRVSANGRKISKRLVVE